MHGIWSLFANVVDFFWPKDGSERERAVEANCGNSEHALARVADSSEVLEKSSTALWNDAKAAAIIPTTAVNNNTSAQHGPFAETYRSFHQSPPRGKVTSSLQTSFDDLELSQRRAYISAYLLQRHGSYYVTSARKDDWASRLLPPGARKAYYEMRELQERVSREQTRCRHPYSLPPFPLLANKYFGRRHDEPKEVCQPREKKSGEHGSHQHHRRSGAQTTIGRHQQSEPKAQGFQKMCDKQSSTRICAGFNNRKRTLSHKRLSPTAANCSTSKKLKTNNVADSPLLSPLIPLRECGGHGVDTSVPVRPEEPKPGTDKHKNNSVKIGRLSEDEDAKKSTGIKSAVDEGFLGVGTQKTRNAGETKAVRDKPVSIKYAAQYAGPVSRAKSERNVVGTNVNLSREVASPLLVGIVEAKCQSLGAKQSSQRHRVKVGDQKKTKTRTGTTIAMDLNRNGNVSSPTPVGTVQPKSQSLGPKQTFERARARVEEWKKTKSGTDTNAEKRFSVVRGFVPDAEKKVEAAKIEPLSQVTTVEKVNKMTTEKDGRSAKKSDSGKRQLSEYKQLQMSKSCFPTKKLKTIGSLDWDRLRELKPLSQQSQRMPHRNGSKRRQDFPESKLYSKKRKMDESHDDGEKRNEGGNCQAYQRPYNHTLRRSNERNGNQVQRQRYNGPSHEKDHERMRCNRYGRSHHRTNQVSPENRAAGQGRECTRGGKWRRERGEAQRYPRRESNRK